MPPTPAGAGKPKFSDNEKVLCFHGPLLYEAKCVKNKKSNSATGEFSYFVHYLGWNKNWDEWVPESRVLKCNAENLDRKAKLMQAHVATTTKEKKKSGGGGSVLGSSGGSSSRRQPPPGGDGGSSERKSESANTSRASTPTSERSSASKRPLPLLLVGEYEDEDESASSSDESSEKKRAKIQSSGQEGGDNEEEVVAAEKPVEEIVKFKIVIPDELKYVLVSDWDLVVHKKSLFNLPAKTSAASIIADFVKYVEKTHKAKAALTAQVMLGVKDFFNQAIERELLYKLEKPQYAQQCESEKEAADLYGSAHLLRLMVKLNSMFDQTTTIQAKSHVLKIEGVILDFLSYLEVNIKRFFTSKNYIEATQEYLNAVE